MNVFANTEKQHPPETSQTIAPAAASDDVDEALNIFRSLHGEDVHITRAQALRVRRKIDCIMLPVMCIVYGLQYFDKTTLSYSSVMGFNMDIGLTKSEYSWLGSVFYFGYLAAEFPAQRLFQILPLSKYLGTAIVVWGIVLCCYAALHNYSGAIALRFFLGFLEASIFPGFALVTAQWWTKKEHALRMSIWVSFNGFASVFGGLVAYGIARGNDQHHFTLFPWQVLFLFTGLLTVVMGFVYLAVVPDNQTQAWWLSKDERTIALQRIRVNQQGIGNKKFKWHQFREALVDPFSWAVVFMAIASDIPNGALSNYFSILITSFGYTNEQSLLYGTPSGACEAVGLLFWGWMASRYGNRLLWALVPMLLSFIGACLLAFLPAKYPTGRLVGYYFSLMFVVGFIALLSLISSNVAGYTKKTTVAAMFMIAYCVGNIIGPETFQAKDAPKYYPAEVGIVVLFALSMLDVLFIYWWCRRQNARKVAVRAATDYQKRENLEWLDLTDWENPEFVYEY